MAGHASGPGGELQEPRQESEDLEREWRGFGSPQCSRCLLPRTAKTKSPELEDLIDRAENAVMVVAHPDDESLWGAGIVLRYKKNWTVICCTVPYHDPIRAEKFRNACGVLGAAGVLLGHSERGGLIPIPN